MREPPRRLVEVSEFLSTRASLSYMSGIFSVLFAGSRVNVLIRRHDTSQVAASGAYFCRKDTPINAGKNAARMKSTVRISRWM